jgi:hypothetical protein
MLETLENKKRGATASAQEQSIGWQGAARNV